MYIYNTYMFNDFNGSHECKQMYNVYKMDRTNV